LRPLVCVLAFTLGGCGYHAGPQGSLLPTTIHTIAIPQFRNNTVQYKISSYMSEAVTREFVSRTRYAVVADPAEADATLYGTVVNCFGPGDGPRYGRSDHRADSDQAGR